MKEENMNKRKLKAIKTKEKIYNAAKHLVMEHGIDNVSVDSIVKAAGVSKGAFYVHFESKDSLVATLVEDYTNIADIDYKSFLETLSEHDSIFEVLMLFAEEIADFIEHNIGVDNMSVLYKAHLTKTVDTTSAISYKRELYNLFKEILEKGVSQGELREDIPIELLTKHLIISFRGLVFEWCVRYPDFNLKKEVLTHYKILLDGLFS
ncbi:MAG: TetR/AcrR family transcriptional regulator [Tissierellaceae bacterium]|nr:TetR/AcrR family transcriptional regulator [Tissierellaceae bacterium]